MEKESLPNATITKGNSIASAIILAIIFLTPIFFIPSASVDLLSVKALILYVGIVVAFCVWIFIRLREGKILIPQNYIFVSLAAIPVVTFLAALFSGARSISFFGQGFEADTFASILALTVLTFLTAMLFASKKTLMYGYLSLLASFPIVALFQCIRLFWGTNALSFHVFLSDTSSLLGSWNNLGIYCGLVAVLAFLTLELLALERWIKISLITILVIAGFFLTIVNFSFIWYVIGIIALIFFVYNFSFNRSKLLGDQKQSRRLIPVLSFVIIIIAFIFILIKSNIYTILATGPLNFQILSHLSINNVEVRPSWVSTWDIVKPTLIHRPILGVGPNRFVNQWVLFKPIDINSTIFWSTDFTTGTGFIPTTLVTTGILGFLSWAVFLGFFLYAGSRALFRKTTIFGRYLTVSSFVMALYLWVFAFFYTPSLPILVLTFFITGLFFASLIEENIIQTLSFDFIRDPRISFFSVLSFIIVVFGALLFGYTMVQKFAGSVYFNEAVALANVPGTSVDAVSGLVDKAVYFNNSDQYYRALVGINVAKITTLANNQTSLSSDALKSQFQSYLAVAVAASEQAIALDKTNYLNFLTLASIYDPLVSLGNTDAYPQAQSAYNQAALLNPTDPEIPLDLARLEVAHQNPQGATPYITKALQLKNNYTDAVFLLAQIQAAEGDLPSAINSVQAATVLSPDDPTIYFELGLLRYNNKNYNDAISAFTQAISLSPEYANAKYFLGLSDYYAGQLAAAIAEFEDLKATNADNTQVVTILENLKAGRDPFTSLNSKPEKQTTPPLKDTNATTSPSVSH